MPYDPGLAARLESLLSGRPGYQAKKMFGGIGWMLWNPRNDYTGAALREKVAAR